MIPTREQMRLRHINIHGHQVGYRMAGEGPAIVLLHGIVGSSTTWREVMPTLAERFTVVAPDLMGHGGSAKPRGDYSLGAFASGVRDLLIALGVERATFVGHSLGGGVAMQLAYQFPERCERLVLVASGGLGKEVHLLLRAVSLPGSELILPAVLRPEIRRGLEAIASVAARAGITPGVSGREVWRSYTGLTEIAGLMAFIDTVRSVIDVRGQRVSARDRLYLAEKVPTLLVWGERDRIIPVRHAYEAHELIPGSHLCVVPGAGHFLPFEHPTEFLDALTAFIDATEPAAANENEFRALLVNAAGRPEPQHPDEAAVQ